MRGSKWAAHILIATVQLYPGIRHCDDAGICLCELDWIVGACHSGGLFWPGSQCCSLIMLEMQTNAVTREGIYE
jgi:hypothetical protein